MAGGQRAGIAARDAGVRALEATASGTECLIGLGRTRKPDTYQQRPTYPIFVKKRKNRILRIYVSEVYRICICMRYIFDMQYTLLVSWYKLFVFLLDIIFSTYYIGFIGFRKF